MTSDTKLRHLSLQDLKVLQGNAPVTDYCRFSRAVKVMSPLPNVRM